MDETTKDGYLAPYDLDLETREVSGINIRDFKKVIASKNIAHIIIIFDCCYAGIATKDTKKYDTTIGLENESSKNIYHDNLYKIMGGDILQNE